MPFQRFVETGRVALVADGDSKGRLVSIVDVVDQTRVLVDGPETGVSRQPLRLNQLHLTKLKLRFPHSAATHVVRKAWLAANVQDQWTKSTWAQKLDAKKKRAELSDFDRFKLGRARSTRNKIRTQAFYRLKKVASVDGTLYGKKKIPKNAGQKKAAGKKAPAKK